MAWSKEKLSLYWLARHRPYKLVAWTGLLLAGSFPPSPLNFLIYVAFVPLFILFEVGVTPESLPEDTVFMPFKRALIVSWRMLSLQFLWRKQFRGKKVFHYERQVLSGNAQLFRYSYAAFLVWNFFCCYWLLLPALGASNILEGLVSALAGILAILLNPLLRAIPFQFHSRIRHFLSVELAALCLVVFWLTFEYLHLNWELSWNWLALGNSLSFWPSYIQYAEFTGVLGISAHVLLANLLLYYCIRHFSKWPWLTIGEGILLMGWLAFPVLLNSPLTDPQRPAFQAIDSVKARIVQPNVDPYHQEFSYPAEEQVKLYAELIQSLPLDSGRIVILPERAVARALDPRGMLKSRLMEPLWALVDSYHVEILLGFDEFEEYDDSLAIPISARETYRLVNGHRKLVYSDYYNSAFIMGGDRNTDTYRKGKLVPMVERVPFLQGLKSLKFLHIDPAKGMNSYGRPDSLKLLYTQKGIPTNLMICYESAFGDHTRRKTLLGAQWIVLITNDGWWFQTSGYIQHAGLSIIRAIENRRSIARAANNGRSMLVDAFGQTSQSSSWWEYKVIDATLPLYDYKTYYVRHGDYIGIFAGWITLGLSVLGIILHYRRKYKQHDTPRRV